MTWEEISNELFEEKTEKRFQWVFIKDNELELRDDGIVKRFNNERLEELLNELHEENEELKQQLSEQGIQIDFLKDENQHMRDLVNENKQLKKDKDDLINFIKKEFPRSYKHILEGFE